MDLLGHLRQKSRDQKYSYQKSPLQTLLRHAPPMLLGRMRASVKIKNPQLGIFNLAPEVGIEPTTNRLTGDRSTAELLRIDSFL